MKSPRFTYLLSATGVALTCFVLPLANGAGSIDARAADAAAAVKNGKGKAETNAAPGSLPIPASVFDPLQTPTKDPFFPSTMRHPKTDKTDKTAPGISASTFQLMALSGPFDSRLAMINHRTLGVGEAMEVPTTSGKVTIRVVQIKETSVIIRVVTPPQPDFIELSLSNRAK